MEAMMDYKKAGVDIEAGYRSVELMKKHIASTMRKEVLTDIGGFPVHFPWKHLRIWNSQRWFPVQMVCEQS